VIVPRRVVKLIHQRKKRKRKEKEIARGSEQREEGNARVSLTRAWRHVCHERRDEISIYRNSDCLTTVASMARVSCDSAVDSAFRERLQFPPEFKFVPSFRRCVSSSLSLEEPASGFPSADLEISLTCKCGGMHTTNRRVYESSMKFSWRRGSRDVSRTRCCLFAMYLIEVCLSEGGYRSR